MALPSPDKPPDSPPKMPVAFWYHGRHNQYQSCITPHGMVEIIQLDLRNEQLYCNAQKHARESGRAMPEWDQWWYETDSAGYLVDELPASVLARTTFELE
ncbi:hypothetical protein Q8F55_008494 [Vanrija albida]|uniref:Uncharacterized protein n=1 Tax=Vanrija albida TaxID=181172 RepID=A0ABR3PS06_9TREE